MPRAVDYEERKRQIVAATVDVLAEHGPTALNFRAVARRMGGSSTLVTHYLRTRQELLDALVGWMASWPDDLAELEAGARDPLERLHRFLRWLLPSTELGLKEESARINLIGERDTRVRTEHLFTALDENIRWLMASHLEGLVPPESVPTVVDVLRSVTNGITLSVVEHPGRWPAERQFAVLDTALAAMELAPKPALESTQTPA